LITDQILSQDRLTKSILLGLLAVFLAINIGSIRFKSFTTDEHKHYRYGENILNGASDRFDDSKMPVSALNALPAKIATFFPEGSILNRYLQKDIIGRTVTMLFSLGIAYLVFRWSRSLYGLLPGFLALALYIFDPNIIAHSRLMTTDIFATGMVALTVYTFWLFSKHRTWKYATLSAATLGLAQLAKYTSAYLYPILAVIVVLRDAPLWLDIARRRDYRKGWGQLKRGLMHALFFLLISLLIINVGFLFNKTFTPLQDYIFRSELFQGIQEKFAPVGFLPVPTPYPFLDGLDWVQARERTGAGYGRLYMLGELQRAQGFKGYYIFASLLKMPIAGQVIVLLAFGAYFIKHKKHDFLENELFLFVPLLFFFYYFNFMFRAQIGIRFYLVLFPLLYVFCGSLVRDWAEFSMRSQVGLGVLLVYLLGSVLAAFPHYIPYFNELIWDQKQAYKYLVDSNLDWDQSEWIRDQYLAEHPEMILEPERPVLGRIVVSPNNLVGIVGEADRYDWLRENFEPVDIIADVYLVYDISEADYQRILDQLEE
jgi:hypothetical protein